MRRRDKFLITVAILIIWLLLLLFFRPAELAKALGAHGYTLAFLVAAFGGVSSLTAASYFATIITLAAAGLNPILLGVVGGVGVTIGDSLFYFFGMNGRVILPEKVETKMNKARKWLDKFPFSTTIFIYLYAGFTPFPNEFMTISVGLTGEKYRKIITPLLLGNITATILLCLAVQYIGGF